MVSKGLVRIKALSDLSLDLCTLHVRLYFVGALRKGESQLERDLVTADARVHTEGWRSFPEVWSVALHAA